MSAKLWKAIDPANDVVDVKFLNIVEQLKTSSESVSGEIVVGDLRIRRLTLLILLVEHHLICHLKYILKESGLAFDINEQTEKGQTALERSIEMGCVDCLTLLLEAGAQTDICSQTYKDSIDNGTFLHGLCRANRVECVEILLQHDVDVNAVDNRQRIALHYAQNGQIAKK